MKFKFCIWRRCFRLAPNTYYCYEHYLLKEAWYGVGDLDPNKQWPNPEDAEHFRKLAVERLLDYVKYRRPK